MKRSNLVLVLALIISYSTTFAQVQKVDLEQTKGAFTTKSLTLSEGEYQFNISNKDVAHKVGFVIVPKGKYDAANHIKEAYVQKPVTTGKNSLTKVVNLKAGEYEYFCPLNPTPKYSLTVSNDVKKIKLSQVPLKFKKKKVKVSEGLYEFEIANKGVNRNVGFVLVPKGKYAAENHIKAAYVKKPVANGKSSTTNIVNLKAGEYEYFCPLNPTPKYRLTVK